MVDCSEDLLMGMEEEWVGFGVREMVGGEGDGLKKMGEEAIVAGWVSVEWFVFHFCLCSQNTAWIPL